MCVIKGGTYIKFPIHLRFFPYLFVVFDFKIAPARNQYKLIRFLLLGPLPIYGFFLVVMRFLHFSTAHGPQSEHRGLLCDKSLAWHASTCTP